MDNKHQNNKKNAFIYNSQSKYDRLVSDYENSINTNKEKFNLRVENLNKSKKLKKSYSVKNSKLNFKISKKFFIDLLNNDASQNKNNIDALDGFRAFAIVSVILYHLKFNWMQGGLLGVTLFFVLSGYLITSILTKELQQTNKINFKNFYLRRIRRLFPAIVCVIMLTIILCALFNHVLLTKTKQDVIPSLFWFQNWWYVFRNLSYFDQLGDPSALIHFWSLAIEEQFYLIWPLILLFLHKINKSKKSMCITCIIAILCSYLLMVFLYDPNSDPTRVYYGTDTRVFSLLIGALMSLCWNIDNYQKIYSQIFNRNLILKNKSLALFADIIGFISLIVIILIMIFIDGTAPIMYYCMIFISSIFAAILIGSLIVEGTLINKIFSYKPLVWIGRRSYGMYLWHYPIILLLCGILDIENYQIIIAVFSFVLVFFISSVQYTYIENPIRYGKLNIELKKIKSNRKIDSIKLKVVFIMFFILMIVSVLCTTIIPDETVIPNDVVLTSEESSDLTHGQIIYDSSKFYPLLLGDSVPASVNLKSIFPHSLNDSAQSRWTWQMVDILRQYKQQNNISNVLICACFSNHLLGDKDLDNILDIVGNECDIFFINCYCPEALCQNNNTQILNFCNEHSNTHLIDWYATASQNPSLYLYNDKTHLKKEGQIAYAQLIAQAINDYLPDDSKCNISAIPQNYNH